MLTFFVALTVCLHPVQISFLVLLVRSPGSLPAPVLPAALILMG